MGTETCSSVPPKIALEEADWLKAPRQQSAMSGNMIQNVRCRFRYANRKKKKQYMKEGKELCKGIERN